MTDGPEAVGCILLGHDWTGWTSLPGRAGRYGAFRTCRRGTCTEMELVYGQPPAVADDDVDVEPVPA